MKLVSLLLILVLIPGCAALRVSGAGPSVDGLGVRYGVDAAGLAGTVADELASRYAPAHTEFSLAKAPGAFGDNLEQELRRKGFAVGEFGTVRVSYAVDELLGDVRSAAYARIQLSEGPDGRDGQAFSLVRRLGMSAPAAPVNTPATTLSVTPLLEEGFTLQEKGPSLDPEAPTLPLSPALAPQNLILLPHGVLAVLPARWKYTIPDVPKRAVRVEKVDHLPWRESIQQMAAAAGCTASFDDVARRVTIRGQINPLEASSVAMTPPMATTAPAAGQDGMRSHPALPMVPAADETTKNSAPAPVVSGALASLTALPASPAAVESWELNPGSLEDQLLAWARQANWNLIWKAEHDIRLQAHAVLQGNFTDAVGKVFQGLAAQGNALRVTFYTVNNVVEVKED